ncbi:hypothetical protein WR25_14838 [Diploscapter pachys]|uniref:Uncharacterized protein n=1 Tax=Diploscapter pachys TaxID=2018661 RepID=A0A2A2KNC6_9BILA|nr:hypothetical protein WR25_14838 [Diploscapter pachys]
MSRGTDASSARISLEHTPFPTLAEEDSGISTHTIAIDAFSPHYCSTQIGSSNVGQKVHKQTCTYTIDSGDSESPGIGPSDFLSNSTSQVSAVQLASEHLDTFEGVLIERNQLDPLRQKSLQWLRAHISDLEPNADVFSKHIEIVINGVYLPMTLMTRVFNMLADYMGIDLKKSVLASDLKAMNEAPETCVIEIKSAASIFSKLYVDLAEK